jgi:hypothetical protein
MRRGSRYTMNVVCLLIAVLFLAGCKAGLNSMTTSVVSDISGTARYLSASSTCSYFNPPTQCLTISQQLDSNFGIAWDDIFDGTINVAGQSLLMSQLIFNLGDVEVDFKSCEAALSEVQMEELPEGEKITFSCLNDGNVCYLVMQKDSDCTNTLDVYEALTMLIAESSATGGGDPNLATALIPSISSNDSIKSAVCIDVSEVELVGDIAYVSYAVTLTLGGTPVPLEMILTFDTRTYKILGIEPLTTSE